jgi:hypothetical protein
VRAAAPLAKLIFVEPDLYRPPALDEQEGTHHDR